MPTSATARSVGASAVTGLGPGSAAQAAEVIDTPPKTSPPCVALGISEGTPSAPSQLSRAQDPYLHRLGRHLPGTCRTEQPAEEGPAITWAWLFALIVTAEAGASAHFALQTFTPSEFAREEDRDES